MMRGNRQTGTTLLEITVAIAIVGILAILTMPKMLSNQAELGRTSVNKADQIMQQVALALQNYQNDTGKPLDFTITSLESIFYNYGNYFAYKQVNAGPPVLKYFLLSDGSRIVIGTPTDMTAKLFSIGSGPPASLPEYIPAPISTTLWTDPDTPAAEGYCGDYPQDQCFYIDLNGQDPPNKVAPGGDIIPVRVEPFTGRIATLYRWEVDEMGRSSPSSCDFASVYDFKTNIEAGCL